MSQQDISENVAMYLAPANDTITPWSNDNLYIYSDYVFGWSSLAKLGDLLRDYDFIKGEVIFQDIQPEAGTPFIEIWIKATPMQWIERSIERRGILCPDGIVRKYCEVKAETINISIKDITEQDWAFGTRDDSSNDSIFKWFDECVNDSMGTQKNPIVIDSDEDCDEDCEFCEFIDDEAEDDDEEDNRRFLKTMNNIYYTPIKWTH